MKIENKDYTVIYLEDENRIIVQGNLRLRSVEKYNEIIDFIEGHFSANAEDAVLDLTKLDTLNSSGIAALGLLMIKMRDKKKMVKIIGSRYISWQAMSLENFKDIHSNIEIELIVHH